MNIDSALFSAFVKDPSLPVFRVYRWEKPAFTIGYFQKPEEFLNIEYCAAMDIPIVRRITGGGAVYHDNEITYSIVCSQNHLGMGRSVKESYKLLTSFILEMYNSLGLEAAYSSEYYNRKDLIAPSEIRKHTYCLSGREDYDILLQGKKIGGNAQRRRREVVFQHGSIPLSLPRDRIAPCLLPEVPREKGLAISLEEAGIFLRAEDIEEKLIQSFNKKFNPFWVDVGEEI